jgi:hypothetical protein
MGNAVDAQPTAGNAPVPHASAMNCRFGESNLFR